MRNWKLALFFLPLVALGQGTRVDFPSQVKNAPLYYYDTVAQLPATNCATVTRFAVVAGALYHNTAFPPSCLWQAYNFNNTPTVTDFGCVGNGVTNDTACLQSAITAVEGNGRGLNIPAGYVFCTDSLSITGSIVIGGGGILKRCSMLSDSVEQGLIDIRGPGVIISNITIQGETLTPQVQINYLQVPIESPFDSLLWRNSSIIIHGGANNTVIGPNVTINHTGGYAIWVDSRAANTSHVAIIDNTITNSRSSVCGTPGDYQYGCWTGGILWSNDGTTYSIDDLRIQNNKLQQVSGNGIWGHAPAIALQNTGVRVLGNYCEDMGLDCIQMENVRGGIVAHNSGKRIGYVSVADNTPGVPKWQPSTGAYNPGHILPGVLYFSVPAVAVDTSALVTGVEYSDNNFDAINGGWYDTDGFGSGNVYPGTGTSCHYSTDPFAQSNLCGPGSDGINYAYGFNMGNSNGSPLADTNVNLVGGQFNGFGGGAIKFYGCSFCKVTGASINHPAGVAIPGAINYSPITYGPFTVNATTYYPSHMEISGNTAFWSPPTPGWMISEDDEYAPFTASGGNVVRNNLCQGTTTCYEFFKNPATDSTTGPARLTTVTPASCSNPGAMPYPLCNVEADIQVEGTDANSWVLRFYRNAGNVGLRVADIAADHIFTPGYFQAGSFIQPNAVPFATYPCNSVVNNGLIWITDSNTQTAGAIISGGGSFKVLASCLNPNWVVVGGSGGGGGGGGVNPGTAGVLAWYATTGSTVGPSPVSASLSCVGCAESLQFVSGTLPTGGSLPPVGSLAYGFIANQPATWDSAGSQKNLITGSGTAGFVLKFSSAFGVVNSGLQDTGTALTTGESFTTTGALGGGSLSVLGAVTFSGLLAGSGGAPLCINAGVLAVGGCVSGGGGGSAASYTTTATGAPQSITSATLLAAGVGPTTAAAFCFNSSGHNLVCDWQRDVSGNFTINYGSDAATIEVTGAIGGGGGGGGSFSAITSGVNTTALTMGTGGSLNTSGGGTIAATSVTGFTAGVGTLTGPGSNLTLTASGGVMGNSTTGNAATATALASAPTGCTNQWATGIATNGNASCSDITRLAGTLLSGLTTGLLKVTNGSGAISTGVAGTDYAPPTSGTVPLKGNGTGGFSAVVAADIGTLGTLSNATSGNAATATAAATTPTICGAGFAPRGVDINWNSTGCQAVSGGGGSGTVTTFSAGTLFPLFTTSVANATTTPALTFTLSSFAQNGALLGPVSGGVGAPTVRSLAAADISPAGTLSNNISGTAAGLTAAYIDWTSGSGGSSILNKPTIPTVTGGTCTNQAVTAISGSVVPTCTTLTSAYVNNSVAITGVDINTSSQVIQTHLSSPLPVAQGGTGSTSPALVPGTNVTITGSWPNQTINATGGGSPGGTAGQIQFNNTGTLGGFTASGDATINASTGVVTLASANTSGAGTCGAPLQICEITVNAKGLATSWTNIARPGSADIRWLGAVCNGTNQNTAVQSMLNAGFTNLWFPKNCVWQLPTSTWSYNPGSGSISVPANTVPANLVITGEDWNLSAIKVASPSSVDMQIGSQTTIYNMSLVGHGCDNGVVAAADPCPNQIYNNADSIPHPFNSDGRQIITAEGASNTDQAPIQVRQYGTGDGIFASTTFDGTAFRGAAFNINNSVVTTGTGCGAGTDVCWVSGTDFGRFNPALIAPLALGPIYIGPGCNGGAGACVRYVMSTWISNTHITITTSAGNNSAVPASLSDGGQTIFLAQRINKGDGFLVFDTSAGGINCATASNPNAKTYTCASDGIWYEGISAVKQTGEMIHFTQQTSAYSGSAILLDMAQATTGGTFTGYFENYSNQGAAKWLLSNAGDAVAAGLITGNGGLQTKVSTVSGLPTCTGGLEGTMRGVSDSSSGTFGATVTGGGSIHIPVYCNSSAWIIF